MTALTIPADWPVRLANKRTLEGLLPQIPSHLVSDDAAPVSMKYLRDMIAHALAHYAIWPADKTSRWIGYVQGVLAARGHLDVVAERDRTRSIYHKAYNDMGYDIPRSTDLANPKTYVTWVNGERVETTTGYLTFDQILDYVYPAGSTIPRSEHYIKYHKRRFSGTLAPEGIISLAENVETYINCTHLGSA